MFHNHQNADQLTNVQIGSMAPGASVTVSPVNHSTPKNTLVLQPTLQTTHSAQEVMKSSLNTLGSGCLAALAVGSDVFGVLSQFGIQTGIMSAVALVACALVVWRNRQVLRITIKRQDRKDREWYAGHGIIAEEMSDGSYATYRCMGPCDYPHCTGTVSLHDTPPREKGRFPYIGVCSRDPRNHCYSVDRNGVATQIQLDWRPVETEKHKV